MDAGTLDVLAARLTRLEKENRRLKVIGLTALLLVAAALLMGQARPNTVAVESVSAHAFTLVDQNGYAVGAFTLDPHGVAQFFLHGPDGTFIAFGFNNVTPTMTYTAEAKLGTSTQYLVLTADDPSSHHLRLKNQGDVIWEGP